MNNVLQLLTTLLFAIFLQTNATMTTVSTPPDPETYMNASQVIKYNGYPVEDHHVQTDDGFILSLQRIPFGKKSPKTSAVKQVVLVQHGLLGSSDCFVLELNNSLAFILADSGYDVWLSNTRGNVYSRNHVRYNTSQEEFWEWSWDEHAKNDLPAIVDYVLQQTNQSQLYYIGHSQGTLMGFAGLSFNQSLQSKIKLFMALAPIAQVSHVRGFFHYMAKPMSQNPQKMYDVFGRKDFLSNSSTVVKIAEKVCAKEKPGELACQSAAGLMMGFDPSEKNLSRTAVYFAHSDEGTSVRNMIHYAQGVMSGKFQMYNYGSDSENMKHYNQTTPPVYDPTKVKIPVALFHGGHDWLSDPDDVTYLSNNLPNKVADVQFPNWDHMDFILAIDAPKSLYGKLISLMNKIK